MPESSTIRFEISEESVEPCSVAAETEVFFIASKYHRSSVECTRPTSQSSGYTPAGNEVGTPQRISGS